jgi:hypothetical protein
MFYVYHDGTHYIRVTKELKLKRVSDITKASYWTNEKEAKSWRNKIYFKYPNMVMKPAVLTLK